MNRNTPIDPGLGTKYNFKSKRLVNKNGSFNVYRQKNGRKVIGIYQLLIDMSWPNFLGLVALSYLFINVFFAMIYLLIGVDQLKGFSGGATTADFLQAFYFSTQTLTTVGYGALHPTGLASNLIASLEALIGLLCFALATGLLYGRFSKPTANLVYSTYALIAPFKHKNSLQFRVANRRNNMLIDMEAKVMLTFLEMNKTGELHRKYVNLKLERSSILFFPLNWTIVHPIDENSPLYEKSQDDLKKAKAEVVILLKGFDDTFSQNVHSRYSYTYEEMIWNAQFQPAFHSNSEGDLILNLEDLDLYYQLNT